jgi:hypothetical protein
MSWEEEADKAMNQLIDAAVDLKAACDSNPKGEKGPLKSLVIVFTETGGLTVNYRYEGN